MSEQYQIDLTLALVFLRICVDDGNAALGLEKGDCEFGICLCRRVRCGRSESLEKKKAVQVICSTV